MIRRTCHRCRAEIAQDDRFCTACGAPQTTDATRDEMSGLTCILPVGRSVPSIVAGYLGLFSWAILPAPVAVIAGAFALWDLNRRPHLLGRGRAIFAIIAGVLGTIWGAWVLTMAALAE